MPEGPEPRRDCTRCEGTQITTFALPRADYARARRCECSRPCPLCDETRYFFDTDENGYRFARPCRCVLVDRKVNWFNEARIPAKYAHAQLQDFFTNQPAAMRAPDTMAAARAGLKFVQGFNPGRRGLLFYGPVGTGKTHLTVAIMRYLVIRLGVRARFIEFLHLLADLRATFGDHGRAEDVMRPLVEVPVLAIDELGKGRGSDWEHEVLDELISKRYNAHRTTLFTTNYPTDIATDGFAPGAVARPTQRPEEIAQTLDQRVGGRIHSRIAEMCQAYAVGGDDRRRQRG